MFKEFSDQIMFLGISRDDKDKIEDFVKKFELSFAVVQDAGITISAAFNARIPTYILIDRQGTIRYLEPSSPETKDLEKLLK